jgi:hypothetical protein
MVNCSYAISWWAHQDLNLGPFGYEPIALTPELWAPQYTGIERIGTW